MTLDRVIVVSHSLLDGAVLLPDSRNAPASDRLLARRPLTALHHEIERLLLHLARCPIRAEVIEVMKHVYWHATSVSPLPVTVS